MGIKQKILHLETDKYPEHSLSQLNEKFEVQDFHPGSYDELVHRLKTDNYFAIFCTIGYNFDEQLLANTQNLKFIVSPTTGLNHIDLEAAKRRGVEVISLQGETEFLANIYSTAEHTWLLILALLRNLLPGINHVRANGWNRTLFMAQEANGTTLGIIGYGRLGRMLSKYALAFGMRVLAYDIIKSKIPDDLQSSTLDDLLKQSDVVTVLASYNEKNIRLIGEREFGLMKDKSIFVNTSRGEMVDEAALLKYLKNGKLKGAGLDVLWNDSEWSIYAGKSALLDYAAENDNLIITPHIGGYGERSIFMTREFIVDKFLKKAVSFL